MNFLKKPAWRTFIYLTVLVSIIGAIAIPNLLRSRMPADESAAISACKTFLSAEQTFKRVDYDKNGVLEYATTLAELHANGKINLVDKAFAQAEYSELAMPKNGYFFKVLTAQGPGAPGGTMNYIDEKGNMTRGFALVAIPSGWGCGGGSGNTLMVSHHGKIYSKSIGSSAETVDSEITVFDPTGWVVAE